MRMIVGRVCGAGLLFLGATVAAAELPSTAATDSEVSGFARLDGRLCNWGGPATAGDGGSHGSWFDFDGKGQLRYSSDPSFGGEELLSYGNRGDNSVGGHYRIAGQRVHITLDDGTVTTARIHRVEADGHIDELRIYGNRYAKELCR